ncbi:hypothetical protein DSUL_20280 [Desulfovibrionales bacterium]
MCALTCDGAYDYFLSKVKNFGLENISFCIRSHPAGVFSKDIWAAWLLFSFSTA